MNEDAKPDQQPAASPDSPPPSPDAGFPGVGGAPKMSLAQAREAAANASKKGIKSAAGGGLGFVREIREFATRGNVLDMSIGVTVGATISQAFTGLSNSLIHDVMSPLTGLLSSFNFSSLYINLSGRSFESLAAAKAAGAPVIAYGSFLSQILDVAMAGGILMVMMRFLNRFKRGQEPEPVARECPYCLSSVPLRATKCRYCASTLEEPVAAPTGEVAA